MFVKPMKGVGAKKPRRVFRLGGVSFVKLVCWP